MNLSRLSSIGSIQIANTLPSSTNKYAVVNRNPAFVVLLIILAGLFILATAWLFSTEPH